MLCFSNAKINLGLNIVERRKDGYHNLETVFYPIGLKDALEVVPMDGETDTGLGYRFFQTGLKIDGNTEENLIIKALRLIEQEKSIPHIDIHLLKKIPLGAGLGGGSSNAATMLKLLNKMFSLGYTEEQLIMLASRLGADCPFFIKNRPVFATRTGDKMEEVDLDLSRFYFVLVKPDIAVNTAEAYGMITPQKPEDSLREIIKEPVESWRDLMKNDFELPIFKKYPEICKIKQKLYDSGALYASMSGSGSSVFALFENKPEIETYFSNQYFWINNSEKK